MGVNYQAVIMVGLPRKDIGLEELDDLIDEDLLECCAPYYDGGDESYAIVGFCYKKSGSYYPSELDWDQENLDKLKADFKKVTGQEAKVFISPRGW